MQTSHPAFSWLPVLLLTLGGVVVLFIFGSLLAHGIDAGLWSLFEIRSNLDKVFKYSTIALAFVWLVALLKRHGLWSWRAVGYQSPGSGFLSSTLLGIVLGAAIMLLLYAAFLWLGALQTTSSSQAPSQALWLILVKGLAVGLGVALLEETLFRGMFMRTLRNYTHWTAVLCIHALVFSFVHFLDFKGFSHLLHLHGALGWMHIHQLFAPIFSFDILDAALTLWLLGIFLGLLRLKTGSLALSIGIHAGIVMVIKLAKKTTEEVVAGPEWLISEFGHPHSYLTALLLGVIILGVLAWKRPLSAHDKNLQSTT